MQRDYRLSASIACQCVLRKRHPVSTYHNACTPHHVKGHAFFFFYIQFTSLDSTAKHRTRKVRTRGRAYSHVFFCFSFLSSFSGPPCELLDSFLHSGTTLCKAVNKRAWRPSESSSRPTVFKAAVVVHQRRLPGPGPRSPDLQYSTTHNTHCVLCTRPIQANAR